VQLWGVVAARGERLKFRVGLDGRGPHSSILASFGGALGARKGVFSHLRITINLTLSLIG
jgi:hypothetical protein